MFTIERTFELPGVSESEMQQRARTWFYTRNTVSSTQHKFDENMRLYPYSQWSSLDYIGVNIHSQGRTYRCYLDMHMEIVFENGAYTVRMYQVCGSAYREKGLFRCILTSRGLKDDDRHEYDGYLHKKEKYALVQDIKAFATAEFEKMLPEIEAEMKRPELRLFNFDEVR